MLVKIIENPKYFMSEDFKIWIKNHQNTIFKVKQETTGNDGSLAYILYKVPFKISKHFTIFIE